MADCISSLTGAFTWFRYSGVIETVRIRRDGYAARIPFVEFARRYQVSRRHWQAMALFPVAWVSPTEIYSPAHYPTGTSLSLDKAYKRGRLGRGVYENPRHQRR